MKENRRLYRENCPYPLRVVAGRERIEEETVTKCVKVWFDMLTKRDARLLCKWWNRLPCDYERYTIERSETNRRFWSLIRH